MALPAFAQPVRAGSAAHSYAAYGAAAVDTLLQQWYEAGSWRMCTQADCPRRNQDWGADALTFVLALRWRASHDASVRPYLRVLTSTAHRYEQPCGDARCRLWSDVPAWDALAALRELEVLGDAPDALQTARLAFDAVERSNAYARGACPQILYQQPFGEPNKLKTLESDSNVIRAALLLYRFTGEERYRQTAIARYAAVRQFYLDPEVPLYTVYVFDDGEQCRQLPRRFFASVNGNMIEAGLALYGATADATYRDDALATARAVDENLADGRGIFADLQSENDIVEPLVEAMYDLAAQEQQAFARDWILRNAGAALAARASQGSFGRFFDGPPPAGSVSAWQTNGGMALMVAAAALDPAGVPSPARWDGATYVADERSALPTTIAFTGSSIALLGVIGEHCCEAGHARVFIDGHETFHEGGIWQNKSCTGLAAKNSVLFAWRWDRPGPHVIRLDPGIPNTKEGGPFLHVQGYILK